jgi:hypothetical protein
VTPNVKSKAEATRAFDPPRTAMESLALELDLPVEEVERVYRAEARAVEADARIKNFVPVIVARRVRSELRRQQRRD